MDLPNLALRLGTEEIFPIRLPSAANLAHAAWLLGLLLCAGVLLAGCGGLPTRPPERASVPPNTEATVLGRALGPLTAGHLGASGIYPLAHGVDAFAARMVLAAASEMTLDVQYYIWHNDDSGKLLANELLKAADRGVHVRLLIDDIGSNPSDAKLLALDHHANVEVRLFNPVANRTFRRLSLLSDFGRVNRRMHNKSFTADGQATIVGGRNIGDEYFGLGPGVEFADLDVVAVGPVVRETATAFDQFWRSPSSVPIAQLSHKEISAEKVAERRAALARQCATLTNSVYFQAARDSDLVKRIREHSLALSWGEARLVYDLPGKVTASPDDRATHLTPQLRPLTGSVEREVLIVSPYFVPGSEGVKYFKSLRKRGVRVAIITNSLGATDVTAVHAGYQRYRMALLRAGVELYEFKATAAIKKAPQEKTGHGTGTGSSRASLHAKTFVFDRRTIFVGSLNLDPRSSELNTEIGVVFRHPALAAGMAEQFEQSVRRYAYRLEFIPGPGPCKECGSINWVTEENGQAKRYTREPDARFGRKLLVELLSLLPIESQL